MNQRQKRALVFGIATALLCGRFPRWQFVIQERGFVMARSAGYAPLFYPPRPKTTVSAYYGLSEERDAATSVVVDLVQTKLELDS